MNSNQNQGTAKRASAQQYWEACRRVRPDVAGADFRLRQFGRSRAQCAQMLELIRAGAKTAAFSLLWELEANHEPLPKRGDCFVVIDYDGNPGCVIRIAAVQSLPFREISEQQTRHGAPGERQLDTWRSVYWEEWRQVLERVGRTPNEEMIVLFQQFEVLYAA